MSTSKAFQLLHMDLFGPTQYTSIGGNKYGFVIVDDYTRYTWVFFLVYKSDVFATFCEHFSFVSSIEPKKIDEALKNVDWVNVMHEELKNFTRNQVWELVERPKNHNVIRIKWVYRNKQDQDGIVVRNKARLVAQGYTQVEGLDFEETYARLLDWK